MKTVERELYDLEEYLRRNDDSADSSAYLTIVGIANDVSEIEAENERLRELAKGMYGLLETYDKIMGSHDACETPRPLIFDGCKSFKDVARELGIEVE